MKRLTVFASLIMIVHIAMATVKDSVIMYRFPDMLKATGFMAHVNVKQIHSRKEAFAGIQTGDIKLSLESDKGKKEIV